MKHDKTDISYVRQKRFNEIYEKYRRFIKYIAMNALNDEILAEDAVQNAFIKVFNFMDKIEEIDSSKTRAFIALITENCCKDIEKIEQRQKNKQLKLLDMRLDVSEFDYQAIEDKEFISVLDQIPNQYKTVLMLKFYYDMSCSEMAEILGTNNQNVRKRLQRARKCTMEILKKGADINENN